ncbi:MAG: hypothetical protein Q8K46_03145, partial [Deltaproteobacteria bacterium]|nr:hypothetical protein [Deltaproteobacteria bacterium]
DPELNSNWGTICTPLNIRAPDGKMRKTNCANTVGQEREYAILTAEISKATFGLTPSEYKGLKGLERENLRDHMTDLELIFSMLGEAASTEITKTQDAKGFDENRTAARKGGRIAGDAREELEKETKKKVVTSGNYLKEPESRRRLGNKLGNK